MATVVPTELKPKQARHAPHMAGGTARELPSPSQRRPALAAQLAWPVLFTLLGIAAMSVDVTWARWIKRGHFPDDLKEVCDLAEVFGHGVGAAAILLAAWFLAPERRPQLPRLISATYLAGMAANVLKMTVSRYRPFRANTRKSVLETFQQWFPLLSAGSAGQSFPSGHTATAVGLAIALSWMFPRGKWFFIGCAALAALQRMASGSHFLSDTLWGAAVGCLCAKACLPDGWLSALFDRLESRLTDVPTARQCASPLEEAA